MKSEFHNWSDTDNYCDLSKRTGQLCYRVYKTARVYGTQYETVPPALLAKMRKFAKISDSDYLIYNANTGKPFQTSEMSRYLSGIFNTLRSIYVSHHLTPEI